MANHMISLITSSTTNPTDICNCLYTFVFYYFCGHSIHATKTKYSATTTLSESQFLFHEYLLYRDQYMWVIIKIHPLFPVTSYCGDIKYFRSRFALAYKFFLHYIDIICSRENHQHKIILFRKMKNNFQVKSGYKHNIQGNYA